MNDFFLTKRDILFQMNAFYFTKLSASIRQTAMNISHTFLEKQNIFYYFFLLESGFTSFIVWTSSCSDVLTQIPFTIEAERRKVISPDEVKSW